MTIRSFLIRKMYGPLVLVLRVNPENADTVVLLFKSFIHSNQLSTYITLPSSCNLFDVIFTKYKIKCLEKAPVANRNYLKLLILNKFSEAATKRNS